MQGSFKGSFKAYYKGSIRVLLCRVPLKGPLRLTIRDL